MNDNNYGPNIPKEEIYKCSNCGTPTFEGDRWHVTMWDTNGRHCSNINPNRNINSPFF